MTQPQAVSQSSLNEYVAECEELLASVSKDLDALRKSSQGGEQWASIYRNVHSLKGSSYLLGFQAAGDLAHHFETALEPFRNEQCCVTPSGLDTLYRFVDLFGDLVRAAATGSGHDFATECAKLVQELTGLVPSRVSLAHEIESGAAQPALRIVEAPAPVAESRPVDGAEESATAFDGTMTPEGSTVASTIRVSVGLLDKMMTLMGEMVLVRNQVLQFASRNESLEFLNLSQRLDAVTGELQGEMMKTRMQPIGNVLSKYQRVVRDLSRELGKEIDLQLSGTETELDRTLLETIKDPLTHIIRNSCDHGIESPEARVRAGKARAGLISVRAYHEGGQVIIEVVDNGRGLNRERLISKGIEKGLLSQEQATQLSEREAQQLIFMPGFSTAAQVTNVSGRGVGMDVVRSNIEKIGGLVDLSSQDGQGTTIRLKIPLTLAIVPAMIVRSAEDRYAIPQVKLVELVRAEVGTRNGIELLQGKPVYRLRGKLLPLVDLKGVLRFGADDRSETAETANIVVLKAESRLFGLIVDEILDTADIVVKPLSRFLKTLAVYSGATVLGDGSVAFILDVIGIAQKEGLLNDLSTESEHIEVADAHAVARTADQREYLLFSLQAPAHYSIPLSQVHRLEEFKREQIELSGQQRVIRYRDALLPLISLNQALGFKQASGGSGSAAISQVVVVQRAGRLYGLEVDVILDVVNTECTVDRTLSDRPEIFGNLVTSSGVIVVVDTDRILDGLDRSLGHAPRAATDPGTGADAVVKDPRRAKYRLLFADDAAFFRKHVSRVLEQAGFKVDLAEDGDDALKQLEKNSYDLVLSDIEMPKRDGFQLATAIRGDTRFGKLPLVALTTRGEPESREKGRRAGFDRYLEKMNVQELVQALDELTIEAGQ